MMYLISYIAMIYVVFKLASFLMSLVVYAFLTSDRR